MTPLVSTTQEACSSCPGEMLRREARGGDGGGERDHRNPPCWKSEGDEQSSVGDGREGDRKCLSQCVSADYKAEEKGEENGNGKELTAHGEVFQLQHKTFAGNYRITFI